MRHLLLDSVLTPVLARCWTSRPTDARTDAPQVLGPVLGCCWTSCPGRCAHTALSRVARQVPDRAPPLLYAVPDAMLGLAWGFGVAGKSAL